MTSPSPSRSKHPPSSPFYCRLIRFSNLAYKSVLLEWDVCHQFEAYSRKQKKVSHKGKSKHLPPPPKTSFVSGRSLSVPQKEGLKHRQTGVSRVPRKPIRRKCTKSANHSSAKPLCFRAFAGQHLRWGEKEREPKRRRCQGGASVEDDCRFGLLIYLVWLPSHSIYHSHYPLTLIVVVSMSLNMVSTLSTPICVFQTHPVIPSAKTSSTL